MTKRRDIIKAIATAAADQGSPSRSAEVIFKEAAAKLGKDWWK